MSYPTLDATVVPSLGKGGVKKTWLGNNKRQIPAAGRGIYTVACMPYPATKFAVDFTSMTGTEADLTSVFALFVGLYIQTNCGAGFWYYNDTNDNTVAQSTSCMLDVTAASATPMAQTGNGTSTQFQLARFIGGGVDITQNVSSVQVYVNGVLKTVGTDYSISSTGVVTFTSAPANGATLAWSGSFVYLCMFEEDSLDDLALVAFNATDALHSVTGVKFRSVFV